MFSEIFPYSTVPSFFIIDSGKAVVTESGDIDVKSVVEKMASISRGKSESAASPATTTAAAASASSSQAENPGTQSSPASSLSLPEKIALTKKKLQEAQKKREAEEREREKLARESGRELLKAQRTREEKEIEQAIADRKRDQQLDKEHRARVLAQIALDNEERKRKFGAITPSNKVTTGATPCKQFNFNSNETRIQFKFPDGHNIAQVFSSTEKLEAALKFIEEQETSYRSFSLSTAYPRRVFTESDFSSSFSDLGLVPSSTLLIIPKSGHSGSNYPYVSGAVSSMSPSALISSLIMAPLLQIWSFISSLIWGSNKDTPASASGDTDSSPVASSSPLNSRNRKSSPGSRRRSGSGGSTVIHRLHRDSSKDDDNNTWNGNSTQQM